MTPPLNTPWGPPPAARTAALDSEVQIWIVVTCVGWVVCFMWLTGPLGWWKAHELGGKYAQLGAPEHPNLNALRLLAIGTTFLSVIALFVGVVGLVFWVNFFAHVLQ
jgi:hypothetical protein